MKIVHFSKTPSAGSPIRLVNAINKHSDYSANLIDIDRFDLFPHDIVLKENLDKAMDIANQADIIHFHHYIDIECNEFMPINFKELRNKGVKFVRQYRTSPELTAKYANVSIREILSNDIPSMVVAQYMERYYPDAVVVPNIIPETDSLYIPNHELSKGIYFSPTFKHSAWTHRWDTKGLPEIKYILQSIERNKNIEVISLYKRPLKEALEKKQNSRIIIDDLVTGSYHISSLEGLSMGKPVLSYLDSRTKFVIDRITGSDNCPLVSIKLEELYDVLSAMIDDQNIINDIGKRSRQWIEEYWSEKKMVQHYINFYDNLINDPNNLKRQESLRIDNTASQFLFVKLPDIIYKSRSENYLKKSFLFYRLKIIMSRLYVRIKKILKIFYTIK